MRFAFLAPLLGSSLLLAQAARADVPVDLGAKSDRERVTAEERPFVFLTDPTTPGAGTASVGYAFGLGSGVAADRPLPANPGSAEPVHAVSIGYGVTSTLAPFLSATAAKGGTSASAGAKLQLGDPSASFRFSLSGAAIRENGGAFGGIARVSSSYDLGRLRVAGNLHFEKIFGAGRDRVDVLALAGASFKVLDVLRLGAEYVGQDLEEAFDAHAAEGGAKHYLGPNAALDLEHGRVQLAAGPAFGLDARSARLLGRVSMLVSF
jgi:hypothetical protein